jgi:tRNA(Ile2) C34 agmatinyltransferase TiaS
MKMKEKIEIKENLTECRYAHKDDAEEEPVCEKCGGQVSSRLAGDESYYRCIDCGHIMLN